MHNLSGRQSAMLDTFSGTVSLAQPQDLPEGASPRCQNVDFSVGSVFTRQGLVNPFIYSGNLSGPNGGGNAVDTTNDGGSVWSNPGNALLNTGVYASSVVSAALAIQYVEGIEITTQSGTIHVQPHLTYYYVIVTFTEDTPSITSGMIYTFSGLTNYTALNGQVLTPLPSTINGGVLNPAVTPGVNQAIFQFGTYTFSAEADTGTGVFTGGGTSETDYLDITEFGLNVPSSDHPTGDCCFH